MRQDTYNFVMYGAIQSLINFNRTKFWGTLEIIYVYKTPCLFAMLKFIEPSNTTIHFPSIDYVYKSGKHLLIFKTCSSLHCNCAIINLFEYHCSIDIANCFDVRIPALSKQPQQPAASLHKRSFSVKYFSTHKTNPPFYSRFIIHPSTRNWTYYIHFCT